MECFLVDTFHWGLQQIDETDIESLLPFVFYYMHWKTHGQSDGGTTKQLFADQADWL